MSMLYLAQPEQQQRLEWIAGGTLALLLDSRLSLPGPGRPHHQRILGVG
jgi:hypothetical protein